jgi:hypothetical protein
MIEAIQPDDAIQPLSGLGNRWQKRRYEQEALKVVNILEEVNTSFLYEIFDENTLGSYAELFQKWQEEWDQRVHQICKSKQIRHIGIDIQWFNRNYKPREHGTHRA